MLRQPAAFIPTPGVRSPFPDQLIVDELSKHLPPLRLAQRAFKVYVSNVSWMYDPILKLEDLWDDFYAESFPLSEGPSGAASPTQAHARRIDAGGGGGSARHSASVGARRPHPHRLALVFIVLSLGVLFDVDRDTTDPLAESLYQCSWAALYLSDPDVSNSIENVQALHLIGQYLCNRHNGRNADAFYPLLGSAVQSAIAMGLHRDAQAWNLPQTELEERRRLFWELYACDAFRSLAYGRPCRLQDQHVNATFPKPRPRRQMSDQFHTYKYHIVRILNQILDSCHSSPDAPYATVLAFDKELRDLWSNLPSGLDMPSWTSASQRDLDQASSDLGDPTGVAELGLQLQAHTMAANIHQVLLHLHRPWFLRALQSGEDPFQSQYLRSVVAVSESSRNLISISGSVLRKAPRLSLRWNFFWQHVFNAGTCQCLHVLYCPNGIMSSNAWKDVGEALELLKRARAERNDVVWAGKLDLLEKMQAKSEERLRDGPLRAEGGGMLDVVDQLLLVGVTSSVDRRRIAGRRTNESTSDPRRRSRMAGLNRAAAAASAQRERQHRDGQVTEGPDDDAPRSASHAWDRASTLSSAPTNPRFPLAERRPSASSTPVAPAPPTEPHTELEHWGAQPQGVSQVSPFDAMVEEPPLSQFAQMDWLNADGGLFSADWLQDGSEPALRFWEEFWPAAAGTAAASTTATTEVTMTTAAAPMGQSQLPDLRGGHHPAALHPPAPRSEQGHGALAMSGEHRAMGAFARHHGGASGALASEAASPPRSRHGPLHHSYEGHEERCASRPPAQAPGQVCGGTGVLPRYNDGRVAGCVGVADADAAGAMAPPRL
ncbi:hypothetical protein ACQY0O_007830 [Thecaphora frezii]